MNFDVGRNTLLVVGTPAGRALELSCLLHEVQCFVTHQDPREFDFGVVVEQHFGRYGEKLAMNLMRLKTGREEKLASCDAVLIDLAQRGAPDFCIKLRLEGHNIPVQSLTFIDYALNDELCLLPPTHNLIDYFNFIRNPPPSDGSFLPANRGLLATMIRRSHDVQTYLKDHFPRNEEEAKLVMGYITTSDKTLGKLIARFSTKYDSLLVALDKLINSK